MKKAGKILLTVLSILSFISIAFWWGIYFFDGLTNLYYSPYVVKCAYIFVAVALLILLVLMTLNIMMFKCRKTIQIICTILLIAFIPVAFFGSFVGMAVLVVGGSNGCSYTEDIANYGKYDDGGVPDHFPEFITDDMSVVKYAYYYKYADIEHFDFYLEVKFENKDIMDQYLNAAQNAWSETGTITYQNPYDPKFTDIIEYDWVLNSTRDGYLASYIRFDGGEIYQYVDMDYASITYSYEELTIIYNFTEIGSDIAVGSNPDKDEYYPKFLERFGVEWSSDNDFYYKLPDNYSEN